MLFSIVTPSYNQGQYIKATLDSIHQQDYPHIEHIVMDGDSMDNTLDILREYTVPNLTWFSAPDKGQSDAINKGMQKTSGDILAYLNSDDLYLPGTLQKVAAYFEQHPDVQIVYGSCYTINQHGERIAPDYLAKPITLRQFFTKRFKFPQQGVFWRRSVMEHIGLFDESLHYRMDYDYWLRMVIAEFKFAPIPDFLAAFRVHESSKTVSQADRFWQDWETIMDKIYARDDLSDSILALKPLAYAYVHHYAAEALLDEGKNAEARYHLKQIMCNSGSTFQLNALSAAMYADSVFKTPFTPMLKFVYRRAKGIN